MVEPDTDVGTVKAYGVVIDCWFMRSVHIANVGRAHLPLPHTLRADSAGPVQTGGHQGRVQVRDGVHATFGQSEWHAFCVTELSLRDRRWLF